MKAATLAAPLHFSGIGLHTGASASMDVHPAVPGTGFVFLLGAVRVPATAEFANESPLATVLERDGSSVSTIEHILSALLGMGVSDAEIALASGS